MKFNLSGVTNATWVRLVVCLFGLINAILTILGKPIIDISDDQIEQFINISISAFTTIWGFWKNNSFTEKAQITDEILHAPEDVTYEEVNG